MTRLENKAKEFKARYKENDPKEINYDKLGLVFKEVSGGLLEGSNSIKLSSFFQEFEALLGDLDNLEEYSTAFEILHHLIVYSPIASILFLEYMERNKENQGKILKAAAFVLKKDNSGEVKLDEELKQFLKGIDEVCDCVPGHFQRE